MSPYNPPDFDGATGDEVASTLFGETPGEACSWSLDRVDPRDFEWKDKRLRISWRASTGYLIALQEVSSTEDAAAFCARNRIALFSEGGIFIRGVAELPIACSRTFPQPTISGFDASIAGIRTRRGIEAEIGYPSFLFSRLVGRPRQEREPSLPDPETTTTLVIRHVDRGDVHHVAELALFLLRQNAPDANFSFCRYGLAPRLDDEDPSRPLQLPIDPCKDTVRHEALAFFNRAHESEPIAGFLYYYRVVEACIDDVLSDLVQSWRSDPKLTDLDLLKAVRNLKDSEDKTGLRLVLGLIVNQALLDSAAAQKVISSGSVDVLVTELYQRRNAIAHGRRGQHHEVLVPYAFSRGRDEIDRAWYELMRTLATRAIERFLLV